ncbi:hypothetical protein BOTBODRAFT_341613 [Botryobasidium botryosum FD-172 SS1]|uniref:Uncharacterized protein n=1 Tax=Botryobasidium botryosum (strain FD-172 SS1) TaxID=930990 RepID=A0A067M1Y6_BOTB1|nr:hypothetical protein BOTBODRAFT_341613 [Botryobasidium botryosum FD-172 SS1]
MLRDFLPRSLRNPTLHRPKPWHINARLKNVFCGDLPKDDASTKLWVSQMLGKDTGLIAVEMHQVPKAIRGALPNFQFRFSKWAVSFATISDIDEVVESSRLSFFLPNVDGRYIAQYAAAVVCEFFYSHCHIDNWCFVTSSSKITDILCERLSPSHALPATLFIAHTTDALSRQLHIFTTTRGAVPALREVAKRTSHYNLPGEAFKLASPKNFVLKNEYIEHMQRWGSDFTNTLRTDSIMAEAQAPTWPLLNLKLEPHHFATLVWFVTEHYPFICVDRFGGMQRPYPCKCGAADASASHILNECAWTRPFSHLLPHDDTPKSSNNPSRSSSPEYPIATGRQITIERCFRSYSAQASLARFLHKSGILIPGPQRDIRMPT